MKFSKQWTKIALIAPPALLLTALPIATFVYSYKSLEKLDGKIDSFIKSNKNNNRGVGNSIREIFKAFFKSLANDNPNNEKIKELKKEVEDILDNYDGNNLLKNLSASLKKLKSIIEEKSKNNEKIKVLNDKIDALINDKNVISDEINKIISEIKDLLKSPIKSRTKSLLSDYILKTDWSKKNIPKDRTYLYSSSNSSSSEAIGKIQSSLSKIVQDNNINDIEFIPYTDIGIVRDSVEHFLKHHSFPRSYRDKAIELLKKLAKEKDLPEDHYIVNYTN